MTAPLDLPRHPGVRVTLLSGKGRGVVAVEPIRHGELIEAAPVVPLVPEESPPPGTALFDYTFAWGEPPFAEAIALGIVSLVNHSSDPNVRVETDLASRTLRLIASRDIAAGEEICFDYGIPLWFEAAA